ncbi:MAG: class I SAM-dependent methyltransferase [Marinicellaceae bacterium]
MSCPICNNLEIKSILQTHDDRYSYPGQFAIMKCLECDHAFLDYEFTSSQLTNLYTNYYPRKNIDIESYKPHSGEIGFVSWFNGLKSSAFRWVPKNVRILDIGCGFGQSLGYHVARGCDVYGVEADENIQRVIDKFGFKVHVGLFDDQVYEPDFFDYLTMDQVVEHVTDPQTTLRGVAKVLKSGGTAILSTPNANGWGAKLFGTRWINWHAPYHLQFFSRKSMKLAAKQAGMEVVSVKTITNSEWLLYQWIHLITYPQQGHSSDFWLQKEVESIFFKKVIIRLFSLLHRTKINHLITRLFDSLGLGDNFVFILKKV